MSNLLSLPGVLSSPKPKKKVADKIRDTVLAVSEQCIKKLKKMRALEGSALAKDMQKNCGLISENLKRIRSRSKDFAVEYQNRLNKRIDELLSKVKVEPDKDIIAREVAVFAERSDISEEIARLESHLKQFSNACREDGQTGRRLEFISQEMLREANTIASKAGNIDIINYVVEIKCGIDRVKEQVQNVE